MLCPGCQSRYNEATRRGAPAFMICAWCAPRFRTATAMPAAPTHYKGRKVIDVDFKVVEPKAGELAVR